MFWITLAGLIAYYTVLFFLSGKVSKKIVNVGLGGGVILVALVSYFDGQRNLNGFALLLLVVIWGISFSVMMYEIGSRRSLYISIRKKWTKYKALNIYVNIFLVQVLLTLIISIPVLLTNSGFNGPLRSWNLIGTIVWFIGILMGIYSNYQLRDLKKYSDYTRGESFPETGPWKFVRHPNYLGDVIAWWGIYIFSLTSWIGILGIVSPLLLTFLYVILVPKLEEKYQGNESYDRYKERVAKYFPFIHTGN